MNAGDSFEYRVEHLEHNSINRENELVRLKPLVEYHIQFIASISSGYTSAVIESSSELDNIGLCTAVT